MQTSLALRPGKASLDERRPALLRRDATGRSQPPGADSSARLSSVLSQPDQRTFPRKDLVLTWCGILGHFKGVEGGGQAGAVREHADPLPCQLLRRVPVRGKLSGAVTDPTTECRKLRAGTETHPIALGT